MARTKAAARRGKNRDANLKLQEKKISQEKKKIKEKKKKKSKNRKRHEERSSKNNNNEQDDGFIAISSNDSPTKKSNSQTSNQKESQEVGSEDGEEVDETRKLIKDYMPWMGDKKGYFHDNLYLSLHEEIIDFTRFMSPHADEIEQRKKLVEQFREIVTSLWEHATVETFGSAETQMFLPKSDVDLVILNAPDGKDPLFQLAEQLEQRALVSYLEVIDKARIPIVKFVDKESNLSVDVAFNTAGGLATADLVKHYMRMFPSFRPLTLVLKYYLSQRSLNETYNGGIGSFMLQLMVVSFLQHYRRQLGAAYDDVNYNNLGKLLIGFFTLYGKELNYNEVGISVRNGGEYFRKSDRGWYDEARPYLLSVENPNEPSLDVGKNSYEIRTVRRSFEYARQVLVSEIQRRGKFHPLPGSMLGTIIPADSDLLAREGPNEFGFDILHHDPKKTAEIRKRYEARRNEEMKKNQEEEKLKQSFSRRNNGDGKSPPYKRWRRTNKNF